MHIALVGDVEDKSVLGCVEDPPNGEFDAEVGPDVATVVGCRRDDLSDFGREPESCSCGSRFTSLRLDGVKEDIVNVFVGLGQPCAGLNDDRWHKSMPTTVSVLGGTDPSRAFARARSHSRRRRMPRVRQSMCRAWRSLARRL